MNVICIVIKSLVMEKACQRRFNIMNMEVASRSPKTCSESIFFPRIESMPSAPTIGEPKRMDDSGFTIRRQEYPLVINPEWYDLHIISHLLRFRRKICIQS